MQRVKKWGVALLIMSLCLLPVATEAKGFKDVKQGGSLDHAIHELAAAGVIGGFPDGMFRANEKVTRGQVASLIDRAIVLENKVPEKHFTDVRGNTHEASIYRVQQAGIIDGYADGTFKPAEVLTRAQMAKIITKAFDLPKGKDAGFPDVPNHVWYKEYVDALAAKKITVGSNGKYLPSEAVTRGHFASFLHRSLNWAQNEGKGYIKEGVVVSPPKVTEQPKPQPKPEPKPQPSTVKVTNQNKYSPYLNLKKDKNGNTIIDGKSYPIGLSQNRPKPGEKLGASTAHWYKNTSNSIIVVNGKQIDSFGLELNRDYLDDETFKLEPIIKGLGYSWKVSKDIITISNGKEVFVIDTNKNEINGVKVSNRRMTLYSFEVFMTADLIQKHLKIPVHLEVNPQISYFGGRYLSSAGADVYEEWVYHESMELKKNGYFAPKQLPDVFVPQKTTKKTPQEVWKDLEKHADNYGIKGQDKGAVNYYVSAIHHGHHSRLKNMLFTMNVYGTYHFPKHAVSQNISIHYVDSLSKFILGDDGGKVTKAYYDLMNSNINLDKNEYKMLKKINVNGTNVYFYNTRRLSGGEAGLQIHFSQPNKEITGFYLE